VGSLTSEEEDQLEKLWPFLLKNPLSLTEEQLNEILKIKDLLKDCLSSISSRFPFNWESALRHHKRKEELSKLPTEELQKIEKNIRERRAAVLGSINDREEEEIGDSFFALPLIDSDEHIVYELLRERGVI
jgi:hypothetical protein